MLIGYGERAGSGIPKIFTGWDSQDWTKPLLYEKNQPEQTLLELRMINLLDKTVIDELKDIYKDDLETLSKDELTILATAYVEEETNHKRVLELLDLHPSDISHLLRKLVDNGFLSSNGQGRGTTYQARGTSEIARGISKTARGINFYNIDDIPSSIYDTIVEISKSVSTKQRVSKETMNSTILSICAHGYFSLDILAKLLNRDKGRVKKHITELIKNNDLEKLFEVSSHPKQAYTSRGK
jgi:predicted HTH transcriptional regulator